MSLILSRSVLTIILAYSNICVKNTCEAISEQNELSTVKIVKIIFETVACVTVALTCVFCPTLQVTVSMVVFVWWAELIHTRAVLRSACTRYGAQCAMTCGTSTMLVLCADS